MKDDYELLDVRSVARATGFSEMAIYRAVSSGELRASKLRGRIRIRPRDIDAWIDANLMDVPAPIPEAPSVRAHAPHVDQEGRGLRALLESS